ncbi:HTH_Tnp_Tc3_2 domain-containing protein [Trichonephila clavipes]|nr:HTH_Tnp_Tc3_2 domain-containing protein [Trichonephila clavipes]
MTLKCKSRFGKSVNPETVRNVLRKHKYHGRVPQRNPYISKANRQARLTFAKMYFHFVTSLPSHNRIICYEEELKIHRTSKKMHMRKENLGKIEWTPVIEPPLKTQRFARTQERYLFKVEL